MTGHRTEETPVVSDKDDDDSVFDEVRDRGDNGWDWEDVDKNEETEYYSGIVVTSESRGVSMDRYREDGVTCPSKGVYR